VIVTPPFSQTVPPGAGATFAVAAQHAGGGVFQWALNGVPIVGANSPAYTLPTVTAARTGAYTVTITTPTGAVTSGAATLAIDATPPPPSRISNLSVRTSLDSGQTLVVGFVSSGAKRLLTRAVGPGLVPLGIASGYFSDPRIALRNQTTGATVAQNDNWSADLAPTFSSLGAFGLGPGSADAALVFTVNGPHTAQVNGAGAGILLVEVYDAEPAGSSRLTNVSARNRVGTGGDILIAGFVIDGTAPKNVLIRGIGPALLDVFGVSGALADARLEVFRQADGVKVAENDNWSAGLAATFDQVGAYPFKAGSKDAALLIALPPGVYTAQVSGVGNTTGDGVVEVYEVP